MNIRYMIQNGKEDCTKTLKTYTFVLRVYNLFSLFYHTQSNFSLRRYDGFQYIQKCEDTWWKNLEKTQLSAETIWPPVAKLAVGNQPPLSVAFRYCNHIRAVHEVMVPELEAMSNNSSWSVKVECGV